jgi:hypothetical protein
MSTHFYHPCVKQSFTSLYSALFWWCKEAVTAMLVSSSDSDCLPQSFFHICKQPKITAKSEEEGECANTLAQTSHQILHVTMAMRCRIVLKQTDTVLKPFWLFTENRWPHLIWQECSNSGHWPLHQLARDGHAQSILAQERHVWLSEHHDYTLQFFFLGDVWVNQLAFCHFSCGSNEHIHDSSTTNMSQ